MPIAHMRRIRSSQLIIFDCDGVLVDSEIIASKVMARELTSLGYSISPEECVERFTGISLPSVFEKIEADWGRPLPGNFADHVHQCDAVAFAQELTAIDGARKLLNVISMKKCVASSGSLEKTRANLDRVGLRYYFEPFLFSAAMVEHGKPNPDLFLLAARRMDVPPNQSIVVEDSEAGVQAGKAAGMFVIGFDGASHCREGHSDRLRDRGADLVVSHLCELNDVLSFR